MTNLVAYIVAYLGAAFFFIAGGVPFAPFVVLWINFFVQVPVAVSLGFDRPSSGLMEARPRPISQPVLSRSQWARVAFIGVLMAVGTLTVEAGADPAVAPTMAFVVFSLFAVSNGLSCHSETRSAFNRNILNDRNQLMLYGLALLLVFLPTELGFLQRGLGLTSLSGSQWLLCIGLAIALLLVNEVVKVFLRRSRHDAATSCRRSAGPGMSARAGAFFRLRRCGRPHVQGRGPGSPPGRAAHLSEGIAGGRRFRARLRIPGMGIDEPGRVL